MTSFSVKEGVKPEKRGFQPMRKKLGEKFGVVFSLTVVVTDTELLGVCFVFPTAVGTLWRFVDAPVSAGAVKA